MKPIKDFKSMLVKMAVVIFSVSLILNMISCEEFVDVPTPETMILNETVFESDATALAALSNAYSRLNRSSDFASGGRASISFYQSIYADELALFPGSDFVDTDMLAFNTNEILPENGRVSSLWGNCYNVIYCANDIIEATQESAKLTPAVKNQLQGEARFLRAFSHFYLVNLFGNIPYITGTDYEANSLVSRSQVAQVYEQIKDDLLAAQQLLSDEYPSDGRVRVNKAVVTALLARVYLYIGDWDNAEAQATTIIGNATYALEPVDLVFLIESKEAIWQLFPNGTAMNSFDAQAFIITTSTTPRYGSITDNLYNAFEVGDLRKTNWTNTNAGGYHYPYKYKKQPAQPAAEYSIVFRLAEQYLIRAEALAKQDKLSEAIADIDMVRQRAGLPLIADTNPTIAEEDLLLAIEQERRVELFTEWGHRWFDLKRTERADAVLSLIKTSWDVTDVLLPIPAGELLKNKNLAPQNSGY